jgi:hypothetical protein
VTKPRGGEASARIRGDGCVARGGGAATKLYGGDASARIRGGGCGGTATKPHGGDASARIRGGGCVARSCGAPAMPDGGDAHPNGDSSLEEDSIHLLGAERSDISIHGETGKKTTVK